MRPLYAFTVAILFITTTGNAELYQYTDNSGIVRFTDDLGTVPEDQRTNARQIQEIRNTTNVVPAPDEMPVRKQKAKEKIAHEKSPEQANSQSGVNRESLEAMQANLKDELEQLQGEKKALGAPPPEAASAIERRIYNQRTQLLNQRIDAYKAKEKAFSEKIKAFNAELSNN